MKKAVLVIDPLGSPDYLVRRFNDEGYAVIALKTIQNSSFNCSSYEHLPFIVINSDKNIDNDIKNLNEMMSNYNIISGFYGVEATVEYADKILSAIFPCGSNNPKTSELRFNKFEMLRALDNTAYAINQIHLAGIPVNEMVRQTVDFFNEHKKVVIKPNKYSAASFGVFTPSSELQIKDYFHKKNHLFESKACYVVQEKIQIIKEYYIDCVSHQGVHIITSMGIYHKYEDKGSFKYKSFERIDFDDNSPIAEFTFEILERLDMKNGLSHIEIAEDQKGFKLIELNPRISGVKGMMNLMAKNAYEFDQIDAYLSLLNSKPIRIDSSEKIYQKCYLLSKDLPINFQQKLKTLKCLIVNNDMVNSQNYSMTNYKLLCLLQSNNAEDILSDSDLLEEYV